MMNTIDGTRQQWLMLCRFRFAIAVALIVSVCPVTIGQPPPAPKPQPVQITAGKPITLTGDLRGYDLKRYSFQGKAKRTLNLQVTSARGNWLMISVFAASASQGNDLFNNSIDNALVWKGTLPDDGEYVLQLGIQRAEARRGGLVPYSAKLQLD